MRSVNKDGQINHVVLFIFWLLATVHLLIISIQECEIEVITLQHYTTCLMTATRNCSSCLYFHLDETLLYLHRKQLLQEIIRIAVIFLIKCVFIESMRLCGISQTHKETNNHQTGFNVGFRLTASKPDEIIQKLDIKFQNCVWMWSQWFPQNQNKIDSSCSLRSSRWSKLETLTTGVNMSVFFSETSLCRPLFHVMHAAISFRPLKPINN